MLFSSFLRIYLVMIKLKTLVIKCYTQDSNRYSINESQTVYSFYFILSNFNCGLTFLFPFIYLFVIARQQHFRDFVVFIFPL